MVRMTAGGCLGLRVFPSPYYPSLSGSSSCLLTLLIADYRSPIISFPPFCCVSLSPYYRFSLSVSLLSLLVTNYRLLITGLSLFPSTLDPLDPLTLITFHLNPAWFSQYPATVPRAAGKESLTRPYVRHRKGLLPGRS